ncbi:hypothetical protein EDL79_00960 [Ehrlichia ruminantium]|uniref:Uncharacterized protein n=1 Tax=Ehrlichia ruminantium TaxID=779 RepID=A0AAE6Q8S6_EHRRU|nr:hypothetical protein [Ehrlichia ruminantium]QGR02259.1 hypothetical protein EDL81_00960 [Ehrlichia ruminantium]QGR03181.1 hypothetical protein EDL80_00960 [Ehrlichia ruminantium]QGR04106.1 hypothetical protein EDL79_00960 [Ehrlichia ruminantium]
MMLKFAAKFKVKESSSSGKQSSDQHQANGVSIKEHSDEVAEYTVPDSDVDLDANREVIARLNEKLRGIYVGIYDIISRQFEKNYDQQVAFFDVVCLSCIEDILYRVNCIQDVLDVSVGYETTSLNVLSKKTIDSQHNAFCTTCVDRMMSSKHSRRRRHKTMTVDSQNAGYYTVAAIQANVDDNNASSTSTQGVLRQDHSVVDKEVTDSVKIQSEISKQGNGQDDIFSFIDYDFKVAVNKSSELAFIIKQRKVIVELIEKTQIIIRNLLQIFNDTSDVESRGFKKGIINPVILLKLFKLDLEIHNVIDQMNQLCSTLEELGNQLSVMVLDRGQSQATEMADRESFGRSLTLNRIASKKRQIMLKSSNSFSGVHPLSTVTRERAVQKYDVIKKGSVFQPNVDPVKVRSQIESYDKFDPFAPDAAHKINEFYIWNCISSSAGREELMRTLILEVGNKDQLIRILSAEIDMDKLVKIFPTVFTQKPSNIVGHGSSNFSTTEHGQLLNSVDYKVYPTLRSFICYVNNNYDQELWSVLQDVSTEDILIENDIVITSYLENEEEQHTVLVSDERGIDGVVVSTIESVNPYEVTVTAGDLSSINGQTDGESIVVPSLSAKVDVASSRTDDEPSYERVESECVVLQTDFNMQSVDPSGSALVADDLSSVNNQTDGESIVVASLSVKVDVASSRTDDESSYGRVESECVILQTDFNMQSVDPSGSVLVADDLSNVNGQTDGESIIVPSLSAKVDVASSRTDDESSYGRVESECVVLQTDFNMQSVDPSGSALVADDLSSVNNQTDGESIVVASLSAKVDVASSRTDDESSYGRVESECMVLQTDFNMQSVDPSGFALVADDLSNVNGQTDGESIVVPSLSAKVDVASSRTDDESSYGRVESECVVLQTDFNMQSVDPSGSALVADDLSSVNNQTDGESIVVASLSAKVDVASSRTDGESSYGRVESECMVLKTDFSVKEDQVGKIKICDDVVAQEIQGATIESCSSTEKVEGAAVTGSSLEEQGIVRRVSNAKTYGRSDSRRNNILFVDVNTLVVPDAIEKSTTSISDNIAVSDKSTPKVTVAEDKVPCDSLPGPSSSQIRVSTRLTDTIYSTSAPLTLRTGNAGVSLRKKSGKTKSVDQLPGEDSTNMLNLSASRISIGVYNFFVVQCMLHEENRHALLKSLISDVGSKEQLIKILVAEIGQDKLLEIFPSIELSEVESSLSSKLCDIVVRDRNGLFIRYDDSGNVKIVYLLQMFVDYVLNNIQKKIDCSANIPHILEEEDKCASQSVQSSESIGNVSLQDMSNIMKKDSSLYGVSGISSKDTCFDRGEFCRSNTLPNYKANNPSSKLSGHSALGMGVADSINVKSNLGSRVSPYGDCDDSKNMPSTSGMNNGKLSMKSVAGSGKSDAKSKNTGSFADQNFVFTRTVKRLSSFSSVSSKCTSLSSSVSSLDDSQDSVVVDGSLCNLVNKSLLGVRNVSSKRSGKNSSIFKMSSDVSYKRQILTPEELKAFIKDLFGQLCNTVYGIGGLTERLRSESKYMLFNWIMLCIIKSSDFEKCEATIINDIKPCCKYYKTILSVPDPEISSLYIEGLHSLDWINSKVKPIHSLIHKGKLEDVFFAMGQDNIRCETRKYMSGVNEELVEKLRNLFSVFDTECIVEEDLTLFSVQGRVIFSEEHFKSIPNDATLRAMLCKEIVIMGNIPKGFQINCQSIKVYGNVQGCIISNDGLVEVNGSVSGHVVCNSLYKSSNNGIIVRGDVAKFASVSCTNGNIEMYGNNVAGDITGQNTEIVIKSDAFTGSIFSSDGIYLYIACKVGNAFWLKLNNIRNVFIDCHLKVKYLLAFSCRFCVKKGKDFKLSDKCSDCEVSLLSSKFWTFEVSELKRLIALEFSKQEGNSGAINTQRVDNNVQGVVVDSLAYESVVHDYACK